MMDIVRSYICPGCGGRIVAKEQAMSIDSFTGMHDTRISIGMAFKHPPYFEKGCVDFWDAFLKGQKEILTKTLTRLASQDLPTL